MIRNSPNQHQKNLFFPLLKEFIDMSHELVLLSQKILPETVIPQYNDRLELFEKVLNQTRTQHDKIYSIHKPFTACIAKGKAHKQYEFGNKIGLMVNPKNLIIVGIDAFQGNPHDSKTIEPLLHQMKRNLGYTPQEVIYDRGGRGITKIEDTIISTPKPPKKSDTQYQKRVKPKLRIRAKN